MESAGYVPAIGATSEIGPMASAAKSESVASARKMPLAAGSQSSGQEMRTMSPLMTSQAERNTSPEKVTARTAGIEPTVRAGKRARKSFTPQDSAATNPSKAELIGAPAPFQDARRPAACGCLSTSCFSNRHWGVRLGFHSTDLIFAYHLGAFSGFAGKLARLAMTASVDKSTGITLHPHDMIFTRNSTSNTSRWA